MQVPEIIHVAQAWSLSSSPPSARLPSSVVDATRPSWALWRLSSLLPAASPPAPVVWRISSAHVSPLLGPLPPVFLSLSISNLLFAMAVVSCGCCPSVPLPSSVPTALTSSHWLGFRPVISTLFSVKDQRVNIKGFKPHCQAATVVRCAHSTNSATG